jgi:branched-chain amino acid transport system permease protein
MTGEARRAGALFAGLGLLVLLVGQWLGAAYTVRLLVEASCYAMLALGLGMQWGYGGLFNAGVLGFVAVGAFATMIFSYPVNDAFWASDGPAMLAVVAGRLALGVLVILAVLQLHRLGIPRRLRTALAVVAAAVVYLAVTWALEPAARAIESRAGFVGGFGLPVWLGWLAGGVLAAVIALGIGRICLGLRSDYLAIATLGIAEIIKAFLKNADWLTRGTLTVSPLPWPVPTPGEVGFVWARAGYLCVTSALVVAMFLLLERAYRAPWGRMMRAIRDNEISAAAMGKDVNRRRLEIFVLGAVLMGVGGGALTTFVRIFDPSGFLPLNHTFLVWVMVILGGSGSNLGAIFGALFVYIVWTLSEPAALHAFSLAREYGGAWFGWVPPADLDSRALQMRVFVIGLAITLVLRFAPRGFIPERVARYE